MEITAALRAIAVQTGLNADQLIQYADDYQGDNERKVLNAIVRALRPVNCLELGTHTGEGTVCILAALSDKPMPKHITTIDILDEPHIGSAIPTNLRPYVTLVTANIDEWVADKSGYDFIFDDGSHSIHQVHQIYGRLEQLLNPGGIILSHDAAAGGVGDYIREGQTKSGYDLPVYVIDPAPWGFSVYRKPGWEVQREINQDEAPYFQNGIGWTKQPPAEPAKPAYEPTTENLEALEDAVEHLIAEPDDLDAIIHEAVIIRDEDLPPANPATEEWVDELKDPAGVKKIAKKRSPAKNPRTRKGSTK